MKLPRGVIHCKMTKAFLFASLFHNLFQSEILKALYRLCSHRQYSWKGLWLFINKQLINNDIYKCVYNLVLKETLDHPQRAGGKFINSVCNHPFFWCLYGSVTMSEVRNCLLRTIQWNISETYGCLLQWSHGVDWVIGKKWPHIPRQPNTPWPCWKKTSFLTRQRPRSGRGLRGEKPPALTDCQQCECHQNSLSELAWATCGRSRCMGRSVLVSATC